MKYTLKKEDQYTYLESGEGTPLIILHGLMGNLSNFDKTFDRFFKFRLSSFDAGVTHIFASLT